MKSVRFYLVDLLLSISDFFQIICLKLSDDCVYRHTDKGGFITLFAIFNINGERIAYILGESRK